MKKRLFAALVCVALMAMLLPGTALAANATSVYIWGQELNSSNPYYHNGTGGAQGVADNNSSGANATFDLSEGTLTLNNLNVQNSSFDNSGTIPVTGIFVEGNITLVIKGTNTVTSIDIEYGNVYGVFIVGALTISESSSGTLDVTSGRITGYYSSVSETYGIRVTNGITVNGGSVTGTGGDTNDGTYISTGVGVGDAYGGEIIVNGGSLTGVGRAAGNHSCGVRASHVQNGNITVNGGSLIGVGDNAFHKSCGVEAASITVKSSGSIAGTSNSTDHSENSCGLRAIGTNPAIKIESGAQVLARCQAVAKSQALSIAPTLQNGAKAVAGTSADGTGLVAFDPDDLSTYKYFRTPAEIPVLQLAFEPADSFTVGQAPANQTATVSTSLSSFNATNNFGRATMDGKVIDLGSVAAPARTAASVTARSS